MTSSHAADAEELAAERCDWEVKPVAAQACQEQPCDGAEWLTSEWSGVSLFGERHLFSRRFVLCIDCMATTSVTCGGAYSVSALLE